MELDFDNLRLQIQLDYNSILNKLNKNIYMYRIDLGEADEKGIVERIRHDMTRLGNNIDTLMRAYSDAPEKINNISDKANVIDVKF